MFDKKIAQENTPIINSDGIYQCEIYFDWGWKGFGFGQISFNYDRESGQLTCQNECMSRDAVRKIMHAFADYLADNAEMDD